LPDLPLGLIKKIEGIKTPLKFTQVFKISIDTTDFRNPHGNPFIIGYEADDATAVRLLHGLCNILNRLNELDHLKRGAR
jgi:hypothetical protein